MTNTNPRRHRLIAVLLAVATLAGACGSDTTTDDRHDWFDPPDFEIPDFEIPDFDQPDYEIDGDPFAVYDELPDEAVPSPAEDNCTFAGEADRFETDCYEAATSRYFGSHIWADGTWFAWDFGLAECRQWWWSDGGHLVHCAWDADQRGQGSWASPSAPDDPYRWDEPTLACRWSSGSRGRRVIDCPEFGEALGHDHPNGSYTWTEDDNGCQIRTYEDGNGFTSCADNSGRYFEVEGADGCIFRYYHDDLGTKVSGYRFCGDQTTGFTIRIEDGNCEVHDFTDGSEDVKCEDSDQSYSMTLDHGCELRRYANGSKELICDRDTMSYRATTGADGCEVRIYGNGVEEHNCGDWENGSRSFPNDPGNDSTWRTEDGCRIIQYASGRLDFDCGDHGFINYEDGGSRSWSADGCTRQEWPRDPTNPNAILIAVDCPDHSSTTVAHGDGVATTTSYDDGCDVTEYEGIVETECRDNGSSAFPVGDPRPSYSWSRDGEGCVHYRWSDGVEFVECEASGSWTDPSHPGSPYAWDIQQDACSLWFEPYDGQRLVDCPFFGVELNESDPASSSRWNLDEEGCWTVVYGDGRIESDAACSVDEEFAEAAVEAVVNEPDAPAAEPEPEPAAEPEPAVDDPLSGHI